MSPTCQFIGKAPIPTTQIEYASIIRNALNYLHHSWLNALTALREVRGEGLVEFLIEVEKLLYDVLVHREIIYI